MTLVRRSSILAHGAGRGEEVVSETEGAVVPTAALLRLAEFAFTGQHDSFGLNSLLRYHDYSVQQLIAGAPRVWALPRAANTVEHIIRLSSVERVFDASLALEAGRALLHAAPTAAGGLDRMEFWRHCLAVACAARSIAERLHDRCLAMRAFAAGLLHDVGKIALDTALPKSYRRVLRRAPPAHRCICDVEREVLGTDHTVVGRRLLTVWKLAPALGECAWLHHHPPHALPDCVVDARLVRVVNLADNLVRRRRLGSSGYHHVDTTAAMTGQLDLSADVLKSICRAIAARVDDLLSFASEPEGAAGEDSGSRLAGADRRSLAASGNPTACSADLSGRLRCAEATDRLLRSLGGDEDSPAVCAAIAEALCSVFELKAAIAFDLPHQRPRCPAALCIRGHTSPASLPLTGEQLSECDTSVPEGATANRCAHTAHPLFALIAERYGRMLAGPGEELHSLHLIHDRQLVGGVLYVPRPGELAPAELAATDVESLSAACGWALNVARSRADCVRQAEALAAVNRRLCVDYAAHLQETSLGMMAQMAAGAAHELNNPLAVIAGRAQMLRADVAGSEWEGHVTLLDEQAHRASDIVSELMRFAKPDSPRPRSVLLLEWAQRLLQYWQRRSSLRAARLTVDISDPAVCMYVDAAQLDEAAGAVITNAIEATTTENARLTINSASEASDDTVVVSIGDNGRGMPPDVLRHACDPFFSHRPAGRGRGLGLSLAARLLEVNTGRLWIESTPGMGTTVFLSVPARAPRTNRGAARPGD